MRTYIIGNDGIALCPETPLQAGRGDCHAASA